MPTYEVTAPDGRRVRLTGDSPPTDAELEHIFASLPPPKLTGEQRRADITAEIDAATEAAAPRETWGKAVMAGAAGMGRALSDPAIGAARLIAGVPGMRGTPTAGAASSLAALLAPVSIAAADAEEAAAGMKGNETAAAVMGAVGSGLGSMPAAMVPVIGPGLSAGAAGLQSYESTRRESLRLLMEGGMTPEQAEGAAHRVALQSGVITSTVTGAFNRWGPRMGLGRGVERGLSEKVREMAAKELARSAARPMLKAIIKEAGGEGTEEAVDELLQQAVVVWQYDPNQTFESAAKSVLKAGGLGAVAGTAIGGAPAAAAVLGDRAAAIRQQRNRGHRPGVDDVDGPPSAASDAPSKIAPTDVGPQGPQLPPGVWVHFRLPDGRPGRVDAGSLDNVDLAKEYVRRTTPGAVFTGIDEVAAEAELPTGDEADVDAQLTAGREATAVEDAADREPPPMEAFSQEGEAEGQGETLLDLVEQHGGINYDAGSRFAGEYDALTQALTEGDLSRRTKARLGRLLKKDRSGMDIDRALEIVRTEQESGRGNWQRIDSAEDLTLELLAAVEREGRIRLTSEESQQYWEAVVSSRRGRSAVQNGGSAIPSERLKVGDQFTVRGRAMVVERIDPEDGSVQVRQESGADLWGRKQIPVGMDIFPDRGSFKPKPPPRLDEASPPADEPFSLGPGGTVYALGVGDARGGIGEARARGAIRRLLGGEPARVRVVEDAGWTHHGRVVEGVKRRDGALVINAAALATEDDVGRVLRHELLHDVWADPATREAWAGVRMAMDRQTREAGVRREGYTASVTEEAALDEVEARVDRKSGVFRRFTDAIMRALYRRGRADMAGALFGTDRLADVDAQALVGYAMRLDRVESGGGAMAPDERHSLGDRVDDGDGRRQGANREDSQGPDTGPGGSGFAGSVPSASGRASGNPLDAAEAFTSGVGGSDTSTREGSRPSVSDQRQRLIRFARNHGLVLPKSVLPRDFDHRGQEHWVWFRGGRAWKVTYRDQFGFSVTGNATPSDYLNRLRLQNEVFGDDIRLEGVIIEDGHLRVVTSQSAIFGRRPTDTEISQWLHTRGFEPANVGSDLVWYRMGDNTLVADAHGGNLVLTDRGIVPIDLIIARPTGDLLTTLRSRVSGGDADPGDRFSLADEMAMQAKAGRAATPLLSTLARDGALLMESTAGKPVFSSWSKAMMQRHGAEVRPFLSKAWDLAVDVRWALGVPLSPPAVADVNRITRAAEEAPHALDRQPVPVYDPEKEAKWWHRVVRPSDVIRYFGGDDLLRKKQLLDLRTAYQAAAVKAQSESLRQQLEDAFYGDKAGPILRFLRQFMPKAKLRRFMRHALPIAAHLNVTGGTPGNWTFADFDQRAGFMPEKEANFGGLSTGDSLFRANPLTGEMETLRLGAKLELDSGAKGYQLLRPLSATRQAEVYAWARQEFPQFQWFLDMWLDPRLKDTRVVVNGVEVPVFNRLALAGRYAQSDPNFLSREAYTPDVAVGGGLVAMLTRYAKARRVTFKEGTTSPGRKYETGSAREMAATLDLLSGFNVRAMQVLQEDVRKEWMQGVLASAADLPPRGLPAGWTSIENAMASIWEAFTTLRKFDDPLNFPQITTRLRDDNSPEFQRFFGEILRLRHSDKPKMLPKPLVDALIQDFAITKELGLVGQLARVWARNWKAFLLLMPDTFIENRTDNYLRIFMQAHRQMILAALKGGDRQAFREARKFAWTALTNLIPGVRPAFGLNNTKLFDRVKAEVLPDEVFGAGHRLMDLWVEKGSTEEEISSLREMGRPVRAAGVAIRDLGPLILEKTGYGQMDVRAKQQFAFAALMAKAEEAAARAGLRGDDARQFAEAWVLQPPEDAVRRAVEGANRLLLNYGDTPGWLATLARNPWSNTFVAFPLFRYHFVGREIDRATAAFRALHRMLVRGKKLTRDEWASSLADSISYVTLPLMGYPVAKVVGALADSLLSGMPGDDDDEDRDPREVVGASTVWKENEDGELVKRPMARELVTANRLNVSAMLRMAGVELDGEKDYWWHIKDYPLVRSTALVYLATEEARKHGFGPGVRTLFGGIKDVMVSLMGVGQAVKVPEKLWRSLDEEDTGRPSQMFSDVYATGVPLRAYITSEALNLIPGNRQADEVIKWLDPVPRRLTRSKVLGYEPGPVEAFQEGGVTGLADRVARGVATGDFSSPLPPQGRIDRRTGVVAEPREFNLASRIAMAFGQNIKTVPREEYREAIAP